MPYSDETKNKLCKRLYYQQNKDKDRISTKNRRIRIRKEINDYKSNLGCQLCNEKEPCCLDFHHINDDKEMTISSGLYTGPIANVWKEIAKCIVLCANCHRKIHNNVLKL